MTLTPIERAQMRLKIISKRDKQIAAVKKKRERLHRERRQLKQDIATLEAFIKRCRARSTALLTAVEKFEADIVTEALRLADGKITRAAQIAGTSYQNLAALLEGRHKSIANLRTPKHARPSHRRNGHPK